MYRPVLLAVASLAFASACSPYDEAGPGSYRTATTHTQYVVASPVPTTHHICIDYGFVYGTAPYNRCVTQEARVRALGRVGPGYALARVEADARDACFSYGLHPGTGRYANCVAREIDARRYRGEAYVVTTPTPVQYVYTPTTYDNRVATTGVAVFTDEYGRRYDAQGNRLDRFGNIISPHTRGE